jgi:hypothetical protein
VVIASSTSGGGNTVLVVFLLALAVAAYIGYNVFKNRGMRPRRVVTTLSARQLREIFRDTVGGAGWSIVDDGNPIIAQSSLLAGIRQQIALRIEERDGRTHANLAVIRYSKKVLGGATKAHTLRWRMSSFLTQVRAADSTASVAG